MATALLWLELKGGCRSWVISSKSTRPVTAAIHSTDPKHGLWDLWDIAGSCTCVLSAISCGRTQGRHVRSGYTTLSNRQVHEELGASQRASEPDGSKRMSSTLFCPTLASYLTIRPLTWCHGSYQRTNYPGMEKRLNPDPQRHCQPVAYVQTIGCTPTHSNAIPHHV